MECEIQIRGGTPLAVDISGNVVKSYAGEKWLIAGDRVFIDEIGVRLLRRIPHCTIAVVTGFCEGVCLDFPFHPGFQTIVQMRDRVRIGDRLIMQMCENGQIQFVARFSNSAAQDLAISTALYTMIDVDAVFDGGRCDGGKPLYTRDPVDLTHLDTFTVDPASSIDLDDAISIDVEARRIYVHIVDIHNAVPLGSALEESMYRYGSTLYLAERVQHLLHSELVSAVSLDCGKQRRTITVEMAIGNDGLVREYEIYPSTICVKRRYTYEELETVKNMPPYDMLKWFAEKHNSSLPLCIPGLDLKIGADSRIASITQSAVDDDAHRMIACAMIAANFVVGAHLHSHNVALPNRFHEAPTGLFADDIMAVTGNPVVDSYLAVKKWRPAYYDLEKKGHFGLGLREYVHFTSPMRRYPDVIIHRILAGVQYDNGYLAEMVHAMNQRALTVRGIQKYYSGIKIARHLLDSPILKKVYVTKVSRNGVTWYAPDFLIHGFTHVSKIGKGERWSFDGNAFVCGDRKIFVGSLLDVNLMDYNFGNGVYDISLL